MGRKKSTYTYHSFNGTRKEYEEAFKNFDGTSNEFIKKHGYLFEKGKVHRITPKGRVVSIQSEVNRRISRRQQGDTPLNPIPVTAPETYSPKWHAHHRRMLDIFAPFYKGLNEDQAAQLTDHLIERGYTVGDRADNLTYILNEYHQGRSSKKQKGHEKVDRPYSGIHAWLRANALEVPGELGENEDNFYRDPEGNLLSWKTDKKGNPRMKSLDFSKLGIPDRLIAIDLWLDHIQPEIEQKTDDFTRSGQFHALADVTSKVSQLGGRILQRNDPFGMAIRTTTRLAEGDVPGAIGELTSVGRKLNTVRDVVQTVNDLSGGWLGDRAVEILTPDPLTQIQPNSPGYTGGALLYGRGTQEKDILRDIRIDRQRETQRRNMEQRQQALEINRQLAGIDTK